MLDSAGRIVRPQEDAELEFYITLVRQAAQHAPALTPRLFGLARGDRLFVGPHAHGHYTLGGVGSHDNVVFAATGTGEAPHNAMVAQLLATGHQGQMVSMNCVRLQQDLAYLATHRTLERMFPNYRYIGLTTREPCNLDSTRPDYIGKTYLQDYFAGSHFEETCGFRLDPSRTHVFLCNPATIGAPQHSHALRFYPQPKAACAATNRIARETCTSRNTGDDVTRHFADTTRCGIGVAVAGYRSTAATTLRSGNSLAAIVVSPVRSRTQRAARHVSKVSSRTSKHALHARSARRETGTRSAIPMARRL